MRGVVIAFANITVAKTLEAALRKKHATLEKNVARKTARRAKDRRRVPPARARPPSRTP
jgi:hypothetical protein